MSFLSSSSPSSLVEQSMRTQQTTTVGRRLLSYRQFRRTQTTAHRFRKTSFLHCAYLFLILIQFREVKSQNHPICYLCGSPSYFISNLETKVNVCDEEGIPTLPNTPHQQSHCYLSCHQIESLALSGHVSSEFCHDKANTIREICDCKESFIRHLEDESDTPEPADDETPEPAVSPTDNETPEPTIPQDTPQPTEASIITTESPTRQSSPSPTTEKPIPAPRITPKPTPSPITNAPVPTLRVTPSPTTDKPIPAPRITSKPTPSPITKAPVPTLRVTPAPKPTPSPTKAPIPRSTSAPNRPLSPRTLTQAPVPALRPTRVPVSPSTDKPTMVPRNSEPFLDRNTPTPTTMLAELVETLAPMPTDTDSPTLDPRTTRSFTEGPFEDMVTLEPSTVISNTPTLDPTPSQTTANTSTDSPSKSPTDPQIPSPTDQPTKAPIPTGPRPTPQPTRASVPAAPRPTNPSTPAPIPPATQPSPQTPPTTKAPVNPTTPPSSPTARTPSRAPSRPTTPVPVSMPQSTASPVVDPTSDLCSDSETFRFNDGDNGEQDCEWVGRREPRIERLCIPGTDVYEQCRKTCNNCSSTPVPVTPANTIAPTPERLSTTQTNAPSFSSATLPPSMENTPAPSFQFPESTMRVTDILINVILRNRRLQEELDPVCTTAWQPIVEGLIVAEVKSTISPIEALSAQLENNSTLSSPRAIALAFDVFIAIRSPVTEHDKYRYVEGAFDSQIDKDYLLEQLKASDCSSFASATAVEITVPSPADNGDPESKDKSNTIALAAGIAAGVTAVLVALLIFILIKKRRRSHQQVKVESNFPVIPTFPFASADDDEFDHRSTNVSVIGLRTDAEVSTLGDPIPAGAPRFHGEVETIGGTHTSEFEYHKAYGAEMQSKTESTVIRDKGETSTLAGSTLEDFCYPRAYGDQQSNVNSTVQSASTRISFHGDGMSTDDETFEAQYDSEEQIEVYAGPGLLGLVLNSSLEDGRPTVYSMKPESPLAHTVQVGDHLIAVDDVDVSIMLASEVSQIIAMKKDNPVRKLLFSRPMRKSNRFS